MRVLTRIPDDAPLDGPRAACTIGSGIPTSGRVEETVGPDSGSP